MSKKFRAAGLGLLLVATGAFGGVSARADTIGHCTVTGDKAAFKIHPAIPGQITVEVNLPAPVWWNGDTVDLIQDGYEYCLAANIAYRLGLPKVQVKNVDWDALVAGQTHDFDLALNEISVTPDRQKVVDFSVPYFSSDIGILVKTGTKFTAQSVKSARIGIQSGTTGADFVNDKLKPTQPVRVYPDEATLFTAVAAGQVDAVLTDTADALGAAAQSHGRLTVLAQYSTGEVYAALYPKGSANEAVLNEVIASLVKDGTTKQLAKTYLAGAWGQDPTKIPYFTP